MAQTLSDGQLAVSATAVYTCPTNLPPLSQVDLVCQNTSASLTETILITLTRSGGGTRRVVRAVLAPNEQLIVQGLPMSPNDILLGATTDATTVDYLVSQGGGSNGGGPLEIYCLDATGSRKTVSSSLSGNTAVAGTLVITVANANALAVGPAGTTSPTLEVDSSTASAVTGVKVKGAASGSGVAISAIGGNSNENLTLDAVGSGIVTIGSVSTGGCNVRAAVQTLVASGTTITNAAALVEGFTYVTAANNATNCVKLPPGAVGMSVTLVNTVQTATLGVFPQVNNAINNLANNAIYNIPNGGKRIFTYGVAGTWYTDPQTIT